MLFYIFIFIIGAIIGSFLNVIILRLRSGEKITKGRSRCPHCKKELKAKDLIPILSFIILRGRCRYCRKKISWQYPLVEAATGLLLAFATYNILGNLPPAILFLNSAVLLLWLRNLVFICFLIVIFVYDWRWYLVLDRVNVPAMVVALALNLFLGLNFWNLLFAAVVGLVFFGLQFFVSRGKWVGGGDLRLGALMGLMLGWPGIAAALFVAYVIGAVFSVILVLAGKKGFKSPVPFGVFWAIGVLIALLWGEGIVSRYF